MKNPHNPPSVFICFLATEFHISHAASLKDKRRVVKSIKDRIRTRFNVSLAEIGGLDEWQRAVLGMVIIGNDKRHVEQSMAAVETYFTEVRDIELVNMQREWL